MRMLRPFPSLKGWAIFISTYFSTISSKVDCGILSMLASAASRYIKGAKRKLPFEIFTVLISSAKVVDLVKEIFMNRLQCRKFSCFHFIKHTVSKISRAFFLLMRSSLRARSAELVSPNLFSSSHSTPPNFDYIFIISHFTLVFNVSKTYVINILFQQIFRITTKCFGTHYYKKKPMNSYISLVFSF